FDTVVSWFTSFGYFDDHENRLVLAQISRVLKPGGRLILEHMNRDLLMRNLRSGKADSVVERNQDYMIDRTSYDPLSGRATTERIVVRGSREPRRTMV